MTILSEKKVTTRKPHTCHGCAREMPAGTRMTRHAHVVGWSVVSVYWCDVCTEMAKGWDWYDDEGIPCGGFVDEKEDRARWEEIAKEVQG